MTTEVLEAIFQKVGILPREYCLDASALYRRDDVVVLERKGPVWCVYYYERGRKSAYRFFFTQSAALGHLLIRVLESHPFDVGARAARKETNPDMADEKEAWLPARKNRM